MTRAFNSNQKPITETKKTIKFLYSYGGQILPRPIDGKLRYVGGYTRVLAVERSITYTELIVKFWESCGSSMRLRCKLPTEDLDVLISVTCDEDLANVVEEYEATHQDSKIRAILDPVKSLKKISPPPSAVSSVNFPATKQPQYPVSHSSVSKAPHHRVVNFLASKLPPQYPVAGFRSVNPPRATAVAAKPSAFGYTVGVRKDAEKVQHLRCHEQAIPRHMHFVPHWDYRL